MKETSPTQLASLINVDEMPRFYQRQTRVNQSLYGTFLYSHRSAEPHSLTAHRTALVPQGPHSLPTTAWFPGLFYGSRPYSPPKLCFGRSASRPPWPWQESFGSSVGVHWVLLLSDLSSGASALTPSTRSSAVTCMLAPTLFNRITSIEPL